MALAQIAEIHARGTTTYSLLSRGSAGIAWRQDLTRLFAIGVASALMRARSTLRFSAPFRFLNELGTRSACGFIVLSASQRYVNSRSSNSESVISAQTRFQPSSITVLVSRTHAAPSLRDPIEGSGEGMARRRNPDSLR